MTTLWRFNTLTKLPSVTVRQVMALIKDISNNDIDYSMDVYLEMDSIYGKSELIPCSEKVDKNGIITTVLVTKRFMNKYNNWCFSSYSSTNFEHKSGPITSNHKEKKRKRSD